MGSEYAEITVDLSYPRFAVYLVSLSLPFSEFKLTNGGFMTTSAKVVSCMLFFTLLMTVSCNSPQTTENKSAVPENELIGVWRITEVTLSDPNGKTTTVLQTQPNLIIFSKKHYSLITISAETRPDLPQIDATDAQKVATWTPFVANAGTYEINGTTFKTHMIVSKDPSNIGTGKFETIDFKIEGNSLITTQKTSQDGPAANPVTYKMVRLE